MQPRLDWITNRAHVSAQGSVLLLIFMGTVASVGPETLLVSVIYIILSETVHTLPIVCNTDKCNFIALACRKCCLHKMHLTNTHILKNKPTTDMTRFPPLY